MSKEDAKKLLERATAQRTIRKVWHSAHVSMSGGPRVQALVGKSSDGFHPGLRYDRGLDWGEPLPTKEEARGIAQSGASEWLAVKQRSTGISR